MVERLARVGGLKWLLPGGHDGDCGGPSRQNGTCNMQCVRSALLTTRPVSTIRVNGITTVTKQHLFEAAFAVLTCLMQMIVCTFLFRILLSTGQMRVVDSLSPNVLIGQESGADEQQSW